MDPKNESSNATQETQSFADVKEAAAALRASVTADATPPAETPEQPAEEPEAPTPDEGDEPQDDEPTGDEPGDEPDAGSGADETPAEGDDAQDEPEKDDEPEGDVYVLKLPGRRASDPDIPIELDGLTKDEQEAFNRLRKGYLRKEQLDAERARLEADRADLTSIEQELRADPAGFIQSRVTNEEIRRTIVLDYMVEMLNSDEKRDSYEKLLEELADLEDDPVRRENYLLKRQQTRPAAPKKDEKPETQEDGADDEGMAAAQAAARTVMAVVPKGTDEATANAFVEDVLRAVLRDLDGGAPESEGPALVKKYIARYRTAYGFPSPNGSKSEPADSKGGKDAPASSTPARSDPRETGKKLAKASARRREAATVPGGGAVPGVAPVRPPKGAGVMDAIKLLRQNS